ncbi:MAG: DegT/DnrJ/EryC1/StrS family aminotransferase, partial [Candidatus Omnitrophica bacterium]|nr:DegT/DnrJ/EryC1/StrS family aminotransferase [Candidatus Omnitrophota bacterium]
MQIPFLDLKKQYKDLQNEIDTSIRGVIERADFIMGEDVKRFEEEFARFCEARYAVGTSSGTTALHVAMAACGIKSGDEVITVPNTFIATSEAITQTGARVVFCDIEEDTFNIDPKKMEKAITKKTKAVIAVHLYGQPADMDPINAVAKKHGLIVIEDAAQAHGAEYKALRTGNLGHVAAFSCFPGKNLGAYGDAGLVVTNDAELAERIRMLVNHGRKDKYLHRMEGYNYRLDTIQAAILRVKLIYLDGWNKARHEKAELYDSLFKGSGVITPIEKPYARHVYHLYVIRVKDREKLQKRLKDKGVATGVHYPVPLHLQPAYSYLGYKEGDFPV